MAFLNRHLRQLKKLKEIHFTVVNGENASVVGITPRQARGLYDAGADVITLGNHTWNRIQIADFLEKDRYILRPANYAGRVPGRGFGIYDGPRGLKIGVINLMGRLELNANLDSPFKQVNQILRREDIQQCDVVLVDFHAEATSEKGAMAWYLDGRVEAVWGTHTHVPTADTQVLPKGLGFVTDLGMTGPARSVLGIRPEDICAAPAHGKVYGEMKGTVTACESLGNEAIVHLENEDGEFAARLDPDHGARAGEQATLYLNMANAHFFDGETEQNLFYQWRNEA